MGDPLTELLSYVVTTDRTTTLDAMRPTLIYYIRQIEREEARVAALIDQLGEEIVDAGRQIDQLMSGYKVEAPEDPYDTTRDCQWHEVMEGRKDDE